jgi:hypothetical protein
LHTSTAFPGIRIQEEETKMATIKLAANIALPTDFIFGPVPASPSTPPPSPPPSLGPLAAFSGNFAGNGFNTIFRPDNTVTPTVLPIPVTSDNILELNLTQESLSFSPSLGAVPNRGTNPQGDIFLNGVPYLQAVTDITNPLSPTGIHVEPGIWIIVPATNAPQEGVTLARMASIPHGTTIEAQGTSTTIAGPPTIPAVSITPFTTVGGIPQPFASQTATNAGTPRIPQDLTSFIAAGTITQAMLTDPNTLLRNHIAGEKITSTTIISISTKPAEPLFGGGADNIAFLLGDDGTPLPTRPNAQTLQMQATFWIETVEITLEVPIIDFGQPALRLQPQRSIAGQPLPFFSVMPPIPITTPRLITVTFTQIQYSQTVLLNFNTLTWPHVSVATLVPDFDVPVPPSAWSSPVTPSV